MAANPIKSLKTVSRNRRGGPLGFNFSLLIGIVLCAGVMTVTGGALISTWLENTADNDQRTELTNLVHTIKLVCRDSGERNLWFTVKAGRGIVFIRDLFPDELREKIVSETGCEQYCLCAIKAPSSNFFIRKTIMFSDGTGSEELVNFIIEDATILGCMDIRKAATTAEGEACFRSVVLDDVLNCDTGDCINLDERRRWRPLELEDFWALPLWWGPDNRNLYIPNPEANCGWTTQLRIKKDTPERLAITSWSFNGHVDEATCTFHRCITEAVTSGSVEIHDEWCPY